MARSAEYNLVENILSATSVSKTPFSGSLDERAVSRLIKACKDRQKVAAIKEVRALACCGLREAKDLYEKYF
jgi:ribosomal protein L7/L12